MSYLECTIRLVVGRRSELTLSAKKVVSPNPFEKTNQNLQKITKIAKKLPKVGKNGLKQLKMDPKGLSERFLSLLNP
jgi:hypothetical protein